MTNWSATLILKYMLNYQLSLDSMFQALADPTRRGMVERLSRGPASVSELARPYDMSLPAIVQHLQVLEASGLVRSEKVGRVRTCRIEPMAMKQLSSGLTSSGEPGSAGSIGWANISPSTRKTQAQAQAQAQATRSSRWLNK